MSKPAVPVSSNGVGKRHGLDVRLDEKVVHRNGTGRDFGGDGIAYYQGTTKEFGTFTFHVNTQDRTAWEDIATPEGTIHLKGTGGQAGQGAYIFQVDGRTSTGKYKGATGTAESRVSVSSRLMTVHLMLD
ncbi:hypothetical protein [Streptomyces sp. NPDC048191]|uniref:hypothetical protein n=1 Tax=Streptomyces sp. NPDC048191 TaxID=3155484 RepID=UPI0033C74E0C